MQGLQSKWTNDTVSSHFAQSQFAQWVRVRELGVGVRGEVRVRGRVRRWDWAKWGRTNDTVADVNSVHREAVRCTRKTVALFCLDLSNEDESEDDIDQISIRHLLQYWSVQYITSSFIE